MTRRPPSGFLLAVALGAAGVASVQVHAGVLDHVWGISVQPTLADIGRMIDHIQEKLVNQGTVVVKQPDIWSQARMTMFRKEYEDTMAQELTKFQVYLNARIARSDAAALQSQASLAASLTPLAPGQTLNLPNAAAVSTELTTATGLLGSNSSLPLPNPSGTPPPPGGQVVQNFSLLNSLTPAGSGNGSAPASNLPFGLEPNIQLDERSDYITHLHRLRRVNLGDDTADSAGYGLYLMRVPVSIQPGDKTNKGFGAIVNLTVHHDFGPRFLQATYRNLVIYDLVDQLAPVVHELIRSGIANEAGITKPSSGTASYWDRSKSYLDAKNLPNNRREALREIVRCTGGLTSINRSGPRTYAIAPTDLNRVFGDENLLTLAVATQAAIDLGQRGTNPATAPDLKKARITDVRSFLRSELESAYDLMEGRSRQEAPILQDSESIDDLVERFYSRKFEGRKGTAPDEPAEDNEFTTLYQNLTTRLPGNLEKRPIGVLCWGIALEAGLLNRQLHEDMKQTKGLDAYTCPPEVDAMAFYLPEPPLEVALTFQHYIMARWPMITFALEPITDQQNIDDAFTRRRDLQLAIAFALSAGRLSFRQAIQYTRQLQYEAQTIALNQTVCAFANGNDTFGWRISPRYQTPPEESNLRTITNLLIRGGPGPNWQLANSKIEPGLRELTAVVVMPSFVRGIRVDAVNNWFRLQDPDERKLRTARALEIGRQTNEVRDALESACKCGKYRPEDIERLRVRLHQLETMLPLQTQFVKVPYENTLGGFALFTQGATALVPELSGFEGLDYIDPKIGGDVIVYGKHFSLYEMSVVVGGVTIPREGTGVVVSKDSAGNAVTVTNNLSPLRAADNSLILFKSDGSLLTGVKDNGSDDILSREIMRVRIPPKVQTATRGDGSRVVALYVSTPTGISNQLQLPVTPDPPKPTAAAGALGFSVAESSLTVRLNAHLENNVVKVDSAQKFGAGTTLRLVPINLPASNPPAVNVAVTFSQASGVVYDPIQVNNVAYTSGTYSFDAGQLDNLAQGLLALFAGSGVTPAPGFQVTTKQIQVQPLPATPGDPILSPVNTTNALNVVFEFVLTAKPVPAVSAAGMDSGGPVPAAAPAASATRVVAPTRPAQVASLPMPSSAQDSPDRSKASLHDRDPMAAGDAAAPLASRDKTLPPSPRDDSVILSQVAGLPIPSPLPITVPSSITLPGTGGAVSVPVSGAVTNLVSPVGTPTNLAPLSGTLTNLALLAGTLAASVPGQVPAGTQNTHTMVVLPGQPTVNVSVPITNMPNPSKRMGLFHRGKGTPQNPTRPPLMERLFGNP